MKPLEDIQDNLTGNFPKHSTSQYPGHSWVHRELRNLDSELILYINTNVLAHHRLIFLQSHIAFWHQTGNVPTIAKPK